MSGRVTSRFHAVTVQLQCDTEPKPAPKRCFAQRAVTRTAFRFKQCSFLPSEPPPRPGSPPAQPAPPGPSPGSLTHPAASTRSFLKASCRLSSSSSLAAMGGPGHAPGATTHSGGGGSVRRHRAPTGSHRGLRLRNPPGGEG